MKEDPAIIPGGLTSTQQPLDESVNKTFRDCEKVLLIMDGCKTTRSNTDRENQETLAQNNM
jgi:hypothetical protein